MRRASLRARRWHTERQGTRRSQSAQEQTARQCGWTVTPVGDHHRCSPGHAKPPVAADWSRYRHKDVVRVWLSNPTAPADLRIRLPSRIKAGQAFRNHALIGNAYSCAPIGAERARPPESLAASEAVTNPMATTAIRIVQTALISGFTPRRIS